MLEFPPKFSVPPLPKHVVVHRKRLYRKLSQGVSTGWVLICAPAGYGKTTLLSSWVLLQKQKVCWFSLENEDNNPRRFLRGLIASLPASLQKQVHEAQVWLNTQAPFNAQAAIETFLDKLFTAKLSSYNKPILLVIDDLHLVSSKEVFAMLTLLLKHAKNQVRFLLLSRKEPPFPLARWRVQEEFTEIRANELQFLEKETLEFWKTSTLPTLSQKSKQILLDSIEGWAAGLRLVSILLQEAKGRIELETILHGSNRKIADYLLEEVYNNLSKETQGFLGKTALLGKFCASLCNAITQNDQSQEVLDTLDKQGLFLIALDPNRIWFRYHHLFSSFLLSQKALPTRKSTAIHQKALHWYEQHQNFHMAWQHALWARNFQKAAIFLEKLAPILSSNGELTRLLQCFESMPKRHSHS